MSVFAFAERAMNATIFGVMTDAVIYFVQGAGSGIQTKGIYTDLTEERDLSSNTLLVESFPSMGFSKAELDSKSIVPAEGDTIQHNSILYRISKVEMDGGGGYVAMLTKE